MASNNIIYKNCIVKDCNKPIDDSFYDKSPYRPLCSRTCRDILLAKRKQRDYLVYKNRSEIDKRNELGEYYKRGHLVLSNYNLNIW